MKSMKLKAYVSLMMLIGNAAAGKAWAEGTTFFDCFDKSVPGVHWQVNLHSEQCERSNDARSNTCSGTANLFGYLATFTSTEVYQRNTWYDFTFYLNGAVAGKLSAVGMIETAEFAGTFLGKQISCKWIELPSPGPIHHR